MKYLIVSKKIWNKKNFENLNKKIIYNNKINYSQLLKVNPRIIFFIHWSKKIPDKIFQNYLCIQFHSSNLPLFKGGSPIQNQIIRGIKNTKISAFKVEKKLDSGHICMKKPLSLKGSAKEIYDRVENMSLSMVKKIIKIKKLKFIQQTKKGSFFPRRKPYQSNLIYLEKPSLNKIYDFIRMLDAEDYPKAYLEFKKYKLLLSHAKKYKNSINGEFRIIKKK